MLSVCLDAGAARRLRLWLRLQAPGATHPRRLSRIMRFSFAPATSHRLGRTVALAGC